MLIPCLTVLRNSALGSLARLFKTVLKKPACLFDIAFKQTTADSALDHTLQYMHSSYIKQHSIQLFHPPKLFAQLLTSCAACTGD